jgi:hypothetical protein
MISEVGLHFPVHCPAVLIPARHLPPVSAYLPDDVSLMLPLDRAYGGFHRASAAGKLARSAR